MKTKASCALGTLVRAGTFVAVANLAANGADKYAVLYPGEAEGVSVSVLGLGANGQMVGFASRDGAGYVDAILIHPGLPITYLDPDYGADAKAFAVNARDVAAGTIYAGDEAAAAFVWNGGGLIDLNMRIDPAAGWVVKHAQAINDAGQITGRGLHHGLPAAYLLTPATPYDEVTDLGTIGGMTATPWDLNNSGQVVGVCAGGSDQRAFLWDRGVMTDLGTLGGPKAAATSINDAGQIVGYSQTVRRETYGHAFLWQSGIMTDLGTLGGANSYAWDINSQGVIIGGAEGTLLWGGHACLWIDRQAHSLADALPDCMNLELLPEPLRICDTGQIAGYARASDGHSRRCFLTPLSGRLDAFNVRVRGGSTIEAVLTTSLPAGSHVCVTLDGNDVKQPSVRANGIATARWLNQVGAHEACAGEFDDGCRPALCDERPDRYVITELAPLTGGSDNAAIAINNVGDVVGWSDGGWPPNQRHAVLWTQGQALDLGTLGGEYGEALDISDSGLIVGSAEDDNGNVRACLWRGNNKLDLGTLGGDNAWASAMNEGEMIVGTSEVPGTSDRIFDWQSGRISEIALPDATYRWAMDVNESCVVVGTWAGGDGVYTAYQWSATLGYRSLDFLTGNYAWAYAINNADIIVGHADNAANDIQPVYWTPDGSVHELDTLGHSRGSANGINSLGHIVGFANDSGGSSHLMLWKDGTAHDVTRSLPMDCPWSSLESLHDINDQDQIVGSGYYNRQPRAFLMTPAYRGNIRKLKSRCTTDGALVLSVKSWLPEWTNLTLRLDDGRGECVTINDRGGGKLRFDQRGQAEKACIEEYDDLCMALKCR